ncbi:MAG: biopolymer transporter ExbD [bacterium]|nr:biopolymer transporter ExbD [bacterium]
MIDEEKVNIFVDHDERIYINDKEVSLQELSKILGDIILQDPEKLVEIKSDENAWLKIITGVMDAARGCGVRRLSIATLYKQGAVVRD